MPNSGNRSNSGNKNAGEGSQKHRTSKTSSPQNNPERSDIKHEGHPKDHKGDTSRSSDRGRKTASGGSVND
jgi:hypothetical protein